MRDDVYFDDVLGVLQTQTVSISQLIILLL